MGHKGAIVVPPARVLPGEGNHRKSCKRGALPGDSASRYLDAHGIRRGIEDSVRAHGNRRYPIESLRKGPAGAGGLEPTRQMLPITPLLLKKLRRHR